MSIIIGWLEASLRRLAHYDFWSDKVRRSILPDSKADLLVYGMGELQVLEILSRLDARVSVDRIVDIPGTAVNISARHEETLLASHADHQRVELPSFEEISDRDKKSNTPTAQAREAYARSVSFQLSHENPYDKTILLQRCADRIIVVNRPMRPLTQQEFDAVQELPYTRTWHPSYDAQGGIPALAEVQFSITSNRGCFGSCSFCAITSHQGRIITNRSIASLRKETQEIASLPNFKGYIHESADLRELQTCVRTQKTHGACQRTLPPPQPLRIC